MAEVIQGLAAFEKKLQALSLAVQRKALTKAVKEGGTLIRDAASRNVRSEGLVLTGTLAEREIVTIVVSQSNAYSVLARIGPAKDAFYGRFPEFGTIFEPEQPFLQPAFDEQVGPALNLTSKILKATVESV
jgi:HK97 gp10 family phage protein